MNDSRKLTDSEGREFPYSESFNDSAYYYKISVERSGRKGELQVMNEGVHIEFPEGDWLDFAIPAPEKLFPGQVALDEEKLLEIIRLIYDSAIDNRHWSKEEIAEAYEEFSRQHPS